MQVEVSAPDAQPALLDAKEDDVKGTVLGALFG